MLRSTLLAILLVAPVALAGCIGETGERLRENIFGTPTAPETGSLQVVARNTLTVTGDGFEPSVLVTDQGTILTTAAQGVASTGSRLWRSTDHGATFQEIEFASAEHGLSNLPLGAEGHLAQGGDGTIYFVDLTLAGTTVATSQDDGETWLVRNPSTFATPGGDREWVAGGPGQMVAVTWNHLELGMQVAVSQDGGLTFPTQTTVEADPSPASPVAIDQDGTIYITRSQEEGVVLFKSTDGGESFSEHVVHRTSAPTAFIFTPLAVDQAGNVYVAWAMPDGPNVEAFYAVSTDGGETFSPPRVASAHLGATALPWIAAGQEGRIAIAYYGAPGAPGLPDRTDADWFPYLVEVRDAHTEDPSRAITRLTDQPVLSAPLCTSGLACNTGDAQGSRALADYLGVDLATDGQPQAVWGDAGRDIFWALAERR